MLDVETKNQSIWRNRTFKKMLSAYCISTFGDWIDHIAIITIFAYYRNSNPMYIAFIPVAYAVPGVLLGQFAGTICDRHDKLKLMIYSDFISSVLTFLIVLSVNPVSIILLLTLRSSAGQIYFPAQQTLTKLVLSEDQLLKGTSLNGVVAQLAKILGPLVGASALVFVAPSICIVLNAFSFLLSALFLLSVKNLKFVTCPIKENNHGLYKILLEGWKSIFVNKILFYNLVLSLIALAAIQMVDSQLVILLREKIPQNHRIFGWIVAAIGVGALISISTLGRHKSLRSYGLILGSSTILIGVSVLLFSFLHLGTPIIWYLLCALLAGLGTGISTIGTNYLLLKESNEHAIGSVLGIYSTFTNLVFVISPLIGGGLVLKMGVSYAFMTIGIVLLLIGISRYLVGTKIERTIAVHN